MKIRQNRQNIRFNRKICARNSKSFTNMFCLGSFFSDFQGKRKSTGNLASDALYYGDGGNRTLDLLNAIQALSQLSYAPMRGAPHRFTIVFDSFTKCKKKINFLRTLNIYRLPGPLNPAGERSPPGIRSGRNRVSRGMRKSPQYHRNTRSAAFPRSTGKSLPAQTRTAAEIPADA